MFRGPSTSGASLPSGPIISSPAPVSAPEIKPEPAITPSAPPIGDDSDLDSDPGTDPGSAEAAITTVRKVDPAFLDQELAAIRAETTDDSVPTPFGADRLPGEPGAIRVGTVMTHELITMKPQDQLADMMDVTTENKIRHLPVMEGDRLTGMVPGLPSVAPCLR